MEIKAHFIFEILGKPPEHIVESLENHLKNLENKKKVTLLKKKIHEPTLVESNNDEKTDIYTTFAEVEISTHDINQVFEIMFEMFPSHVEIIEPDELVLKNFELSELLTALTIRLHKYDEVSKVLLLERKRLLEKLREYYNEVQNSKKSTKTSKKTKKTQTKKQDS